MKKLLPVALSVGLVFSLSCQPAVFASGSQTIEAKKEMNTLSIEDVVKRGMEKNSALLLLDYQMQILYNQKKQTESDRDDTESDLNSAISDHNKIRNEIRDLDKFTGELTEKIAGLKIELKHQKDKLEENSPPLSDEDIEFIEEAIADLNKQIERVESQYKELSGAKDQLKQAASGLAAQVEALEDALAQLRLAVKKIGSNEIKFSYEAEEVKTITEMMLKSSFVKLLSTQKQLDFSKEAAKNVDNEFKLMKRRVELGLESEYELEKLGRDVDDQTRELKIAEQDYEREMAKLAMDLDIPYHDKLTLKQLKLERPRPVKRESKTDELIAKSYAYKKAQEDLKVANYDLDHMKEHGSEFERNQAVLGVKVQEETIRQLKVDLEKEIDDLFIEADKAFSKVGEKNRAYNNASRDHSKLEKQYKVGILSKYQFEQAELAIKQTVLERELAEVSYYMMMEQIKALENGVIQTQSQASGQMG